MTQAEREIARRNAVQWAEKHLPKVKMPNGRVASRMVVRTEDGLEFVVGKRFINKTFSLNKNNDRLAETMELATLVNEWAKNATNIGIEEGIHHDYNFYVFTAVYQGRKIVFKAKDTDGLIAYTMHIE